MKRYRVLRMDFDFRANFLNLPIDESWDPKFKQQHNDNKQKVREGLVQEHGPDPHELKLKNFTDLGAAPFSILAYHNRFLHQIRDAFVIGSYYPALTAACALGERILNHLVLELRDSYKATPEYKAVYRKHSFDNWDIPIKTLTAWKVLQPEVVTAFNELEKIRHAAIHFRPEVDHNDRELALSAVQTLGRIIDGQFSAFGAHPWFIPNTPGTAFLRKASEANPFIRTIYIPNCQLVGPYHKIGARDGKWILIDDFEYEYKEVTDEEFADLFNKGSP